MSNKESNNLLKGDIDIRLGGNVLIPLSELQNRRVNISAKAGVFIGSITKDSNGLNIVHGGGRAILTKVGQETQIGPGSRCYLRLDKENLSISNRYSIAIIYNISDLPSDKIPDDPSEEVESFRDRVSGAFKKLFGR
ncbi:MAG: hypothetical protein AAB836_01555 [Patescibacteria group bacterium]